MQFFCSQNRSLKQHISSVHKQEKNFKFYICEHHFSEKGNLNQHVNAVHKHGQKENFKCFKCNKCDFSSSDKRNLK